MCNLGIEHLLHVFFDCQFARDCWQYAGRSYDMQDVEYGPDWLVQKLSSVGDDESILIAKALWGIWFFRNKKV